jgi:alpha-glucosidase
MHDAQNLFDTKTSYAGEWQIDEYLDTSHTNQSIVIGIEHGNAKRIDELTPFKNEKYGGGNGNNYLLFIKNTLKPFIDKNYRTLTNSSNTTIFGSSLGGLISFYAAIKYPYTFGKAGVFSPAFWINPEVFEEVKSAKIPKSTKFYFLAGTAESETMISDIADMTKLLSEKYIPKEHIKTEIIKDGEHNELLWSTYFGQAYNWLY